MVTIEKIMELKFRLKGKRNRSFVKVKTKNFRKKPGFRHCVYVQQVYAYNGSFINDVTRGGVNKFATT